MATSPATELDLSNRSLRTLSDQEKSVGGYLLEDAWNIITTQVPSVAERLDVVPLDTAFQSVVVQVQCAMVLRVLNNPDGKLEEAVDDYRYRLDQAVSTGALYLSDAERALLGTNDSSADGAFTIRPGGVPTGTGWWTRPDVWTTD